MRGTAADVVGLGGHDKGGGGGTGAAGKCGWEYDDLQERGEVKKNHLTSSIV